jgi:hypothetical protein
MLAPILLPIRAELAWSDHATALGIVARSSGPVLTLCRMLLEAGHDPATRLEAWRGGTLCLVVRRIGEAAGLQINSHGTGFEPVRERRAASPMRQTDTPLCPIAEAAE